MRKQYFFINMVVLFLPCVTLAVDICDACAMSFRMQLSFKKNVSQFLCAKNLLHFESFDEDEFGIGESVEI